MSVATGVFAAPVLLDSAGLKSIRFRLWKDLGAIVCLDVMLGASGPSLNILFVNLCVEAPLLPASSSRMPSGDGRVVFKRYCPVGLCSCRCSFVWGGWRVCGSSGFGICGLSLYVFALDRSVSESPFECSFGH